MLLRRSVVNHAVHSIACSCAKLKFHTPELQKIGGEIRALLLCGSGHGPVVRSLAASCRSDVVGCRAAPSRASNNAKAIPGQCRLCMEYCKWHLVSRVGPCVFEISQRAGLCMICAFSRYDPVFIPFPVPLLSLPMYGHELPVFFQKK